MKCVGVSERTYTVSDPHNIQQSIGSNSLPIQLALQEMWGWMLRFALKEKKMRCTEGPVWNPHRQQLRRGSVTTPDSRSDEASPAGTRTRSLQIPQRGSLPGQTDRAGRVVGRMKPKEVPASLTPIAPNPSHPRGPELPASQQSPNFFSAHKAANSAAPPSLGRAPPPPPGSAPNASLQWPLRASEVTQRATSERALVGLQSRGLKAPSSQGDDAHPLRHSPMASAGRAGGFRQLLPLALQAWLSRV
uniref:Uncharacterized protein n=1 Tax=Sphaerodactylus townsendi TaxID=933632 RepID=A0ACB8FIJ4_9SAUR